MSSVVSAMLLFSLPAFALEPSQDVSQYGHTSWSLRDGAFKGYPSSLAQTPDGYLWLGTELGLLRFDGVRFSLWQPPEGALPSNFVIRLLAARDGSLWIGTSQGLARWGEGKLTAYAELAGQYILAIREDRAGTIWAGTQVDPTSRAKLCAVRAQAVECSGDDGTLGHFVSSVYEDDAHQLWVGAATGLWRWSPSPARKYPTPFPEVQAILQDASGTVLAALPRGIRKVGEQSLEPYPLPIEIDPLKPTAVLRDRDGALWIGTQDRGVLHVRGNRADQFSRADGLSSEAVVNIFEDGEGNVWVATLSGLDRFRNTAAATITTRQGLPSDGVMSVLAGEGGSVWLRTLTGLERWNAGQFTRYGSRLGLSYDAGSSLFQDSRKRLWVSSPRGLAYLDNGVVTAVGGGVQGVVLAMGEDRAGSLWLSDQSRGLIRVREGQPAEVTPWSSLGGGIARAIAADPSADGVWLGFSVGGVSRFKNGRTQVSYTDADGLGRGEVFGLLLEPGNVLWAATENGLSRLKDGEWKTLTTKNGLPCDALHSVIADDHGALWVHAVCGLVRIPREELERWAADPRIRIRSSIYDDSDGFPSHARLSSYSPSVTKAADGRLWFATYEGAVVIDPGNLPFNRIPPPVHIEQVTADRQTYNPTSLLRLSAGTRDLRVDYTALSFVIPERVKFRYKLEGRDAEWVDAGDRRQAFYTDLPPARYRFRVIAANNDGVWNERGDSWQFEIPPAFYQTTWFKTASVFVFIGGLFSLYSIRMRRLAAQLNVRFEERLAERTRIAQELHDTLLQGSISASMQLHVLAGQVVDDPIKSKLDHILQRFRQMIDEGRQTVQALRTSPTVSDALEHALTRDGKDLSSGLPVDVRVTLHGQSRPLHPLVRDDCYRIGREALANAIRHSRANVINIEIAYYTDRLRLWVSDDGRGIDPAVLAAGRPGHWGLLGMRERAKHIGATITIESQPGCGTEVELIVPGVFAFEQGPARAANRAASTAPSPADAARGAGGWFQRGKKRPPESRSTV